ncbi:transcriptional regulator, partial [Acetobacter syzygii]
MVYGLNVAAVIAFLGFLWLFGGLVGSMTVKFNKDYFVWLIVALLVIVTIHEVLHGILYKVFKPNGKIKVRFRSGMLSVSSPKSL